MGSLPVRGIAAVGGGEIRLATAVGIHDEDVREAADIALEGDHRAIRRPCRFDVGERVGRQRRLLSTVGVHDKNLLRIGGAVPAERDPSPVPRPRRVHTKRDVRVKVRPAGAVDIHHADMNADTSFIRRKSNPSPVG